MKMIEFGLKRGLVKWKIDELFDELYITIKEVYPNNDEDVIKIFTDLANKEIEDEFETPEDNLLRDYEVR